MVAVDLPQDMRRHQKDTGADDGAHNQQGKVSQTKGAKEFGHDGRVIIGGS